MIRSTMPRTPGTPTARRSAPARRRSRVATWLALAFPLFFFLVIAGGIYSIKMGLLGLFLPSLPHPPPAAQAPPNR